MAKHFEVWLAIQHVWLAMRNYMMYFPLELAIIRTICHNILKNSHFVIDFCMILTIHIFL